MSKAEKIAEGHRHRVAANEKKLARAKRGGTPEKVDKLEKVLNRQRAFLKTAEERVLYEAMRARSAKRRAKMEAEDLAVIDRRAAKLQPTAAALQKSETQGRRSPAKPRTAAERVERKDTIVDSPYGREHGVDAVVRVFHTIESMRRRHQINERQKMAADRYRWAFEVCPSSIRCALDTSGRGGGEVFRSPTDDQSQAVEWLIEADKLLGKTDSVVIRLICGEGESIETVARRRFATPLGKRPNGNEIVVIGDRLRTGLSVLADHWWRERQRMRGFMGEDAKPSSAEAREAWDPAAFKGRVAHATESRVLGFESAEGHPDLRLKPVRKSKRR